MCKGADLRVRGEKVKDGLFEEMRIMIEEVRGRRVERSKREKRGGKKERTAALFFLSVWSCAASSFSQVSERLFALFFRICRGSPSGKSHPWVTEGER